MDSSLERLLETQRLKDKELERQEFLEKYSNLPENVQNAIMLA
jgi:hypothetical protein